MKQFAFPLSIKCASVEERDECLNLLESIGYENKHGKMFDSETLVVTNYYNISNNMTMWAFKSDYDSNRHHIDHFNPELIRDIASACTNDTWQKGEPWYSNDIKFSSPNNNGGIFGFEGGKIGECSMRRPTLAEICEHHGYKVVGRDIVKKEPWHEQVANVSSLVKNSHDSFNKCCANTDGKSVDKIVKDALTDFDFIAVHNAMDATNWTWHGDYEAPTIFELVSRAERLIRDCIKDDLSAISSGGFNVYIIGDEINITFSIASGSAELTK